MNRFTSPSLTMGFSKSLNDIIKEMCIKEIPYCVYKEDTPKKGRTFPVSSLQFKKNLRT